MGCLWKILGASRISHIRNTDIKNQLNIQHDIVDRIRSRRLRYFCHEFWMQPSRWPHQLTEPYMIVFTETDAEDDRGSTGLIIFRTIARWWDSHSHKQHTRLKAEDNEQNRRGCPSMLNCIAMTPEEGSHSQWWCLYVCEMEWCLHCVGRFLFSPLLCILSSCITKTVSWNSFTVSHNYMETMIKNLDSVKSKRWVWATLVILSFTNPEVTWKSFKQATNWSIIDWSQVDVSFDCF